MSQLKSLIEATVEYVNIDPVGKKLCIGIVSANKEKLIQIVADGVDDLLVNDLRLSNIIDQVLIHEVGESSEVAERLFYFLRGVKPTPSDLEWEVLKNKLACIKKGDLTFIEIEPVYGAVIMILAARIEFIENNANAGHPH